MIVDQNETIFYSVDPETGSHCGLQSNVEASQPDVHLYTLQGVVLFNSALHNPFTSLNLVFLLSLSSFAGIEGDADAVVDFVSRALADVSGRGRHRQALQADLGNCEGGVAVELWNWVLW